MKIAYLSTFYPYRGGISQFNASLYRALEKEHTIRAFTFTRQYPDFLFPGKTQMVTKEENVDQMDALRVLDSINPLSYYKTAREIQKFNPDVLIMKYWMSFFGLSLGTVAGRLFKKTKIITILDNVIPHEKRFFDTAFTQYFLKRNHGFIAMSDKVRDDLLSLAPQSKNIRLDHPLYDHFGLKLSAQDSRKQLGIHPDKKTILFFGFIRDYKGLDVLIEAFDRLDDSYQLVIAGETYGSFSKYDQLISQVKYRENVFVFNDYIPDSKVPVFFSAADICILPYRSATQSGITSIAYHFEVPLIATDVGGLKEAIQDGKTGLMVDNCSPEAIEQAIQKFFSQGMKDILVEGIGEIKDKLSWGNFAKALVDFSNDL